MRASTEGNALSVWTGTSATTVTANAGVSPSGANDASKVAATATTAAHTRQQTVEFVSGSSYTFSIFAKVGGWSTLQIAVGSAAFSGLPYANFDLSTGSVVGGGGASFSITPFGNGWYRCTMTATATATTSTTAQFIVYNTPNPGRASSVLGNGIDGILAWGAQIEVGAFATSYIPTTNAASTRNADVASVTGANFSNWWQAAKGGAMVQAIPSTVLGVRPLVQFDDGTANEIIALRGNTTIGIRHQLLPNIGTGSSVITGNSITNSAGTASTDTAIYVDQATGSAAVLEGVIIANNRMEGALENGIRVYANAGNIKNVSITGNVMADIATTVGCQLRADAGLSIEDFTITGNVFKCSGTQNLYLLGTTAPNILNGTICGNTIKGGTTFCIRMIQTQNVVETGNYNTGATRKVQIDTGSSLITLDRRQSSVVTMTNATYTVLDQDEYLIANRAGTVTVTLPVAASHPGRELYVKTIQAQAVDSNASNVVPITDTAAGTAILPATDGAWALLKSDGTNWIVMQRGT